MGTSEGLYANCLPYLTRSMSHTDRRCRATYISGVGGELGNVSTDNSGRVTSQLQAAMKMMEVNDGVVPDCVI